MAFTAESIAPYLENMNKDYYGRKVWAEQFAGIDANKQASLEGLDSAYSDAVATAYLSSKQNAANIMGSNLISGQKTAMLEANDAALEEAYNSYMQNRAQSVQTVVDTANQQMASVNKALTDQSKMFAKYGNAHLDYLEHLYANNSEIFNNPRFANYMTTAYNANGDAEQVLRSRGELENMIFDPSGGITTAGRAFFDQLENDELLRGDSFGSYLHANDEELYNWAMSDNPYNYAPDAAGRNTMASSFAQFAIGDGEEQFTNIEHFFGLTPDTLNKRLASLQNLIDDSKGTKDDITELSNEISKLLSDYGLSEMFNEELAKGEYDNVNEYVQDILNTDARLTFEDVKSAFDKPWTSSGAGLVVDLIVSSVNNQREDRKESAHDLIVKLADFAKAKYDENVNSFYTQETAKGYTVQAYDKTIAKSKDGTHYDYRLPDGGDVRFLSGAELKGASNVRDVDNDNFRIKYGGLTFKLEAGKETLDSNVAGKVADKVSQSLGRQLRTGDVFYYNNKLWVITKDGNARNVRNRVNATDYRQLMSLVKGDATLQDITVQRAANMS